MKKPFKLAVIVIIAVIAITAGYFVYLQKPIKALTPPVLEEGSVIYQGAAMISDAKVYKYFPDYCKGTDNRLDVTKPNCASPTQYTECSPATGFTVPTGTAIDLVNGVNYFYSSTSVKLSDLLDSYIFPSYGTSLFVAYFGKDDQKFHIYPEKPYADVIFMTRDSLIPANTGFFIAVNYITPSACTNAGKNPKIWNVNSAATALPAASTLTFFVDTAEGWMLMPLKTGALSATFGDKLSRILSVWAVSNISYEPISLRDTTVTTRPSNLAWVYMGKVGVEPPECTANTDCGSGKICTNNTCVTGCSTNTDCTALETCDTTTHSCILASGKCNTIADCDAWEDCTSNSCVLKTGKCNTTIDCTDEKTCNDSHDCAYVCGNSIVEGTEECDDDTAGCDTDCTCKENYTIIRVAGYMNEPGQSFCSSNCGNDIIDGSEVCDDANCDAACSACNAGYALNDENICAVNNCGNGVLDVGEECDDSGEVTPVGLEDGCDSQCKFIVGYDQVNENYYVNATKITANNYSYNLLNSSMNTCNKLCQAMISEHKMSNFTGASMYFTSCDKVQMFYNNVWVDDNITYPDVNIVTVLPRRVFCSGVSVGQ
jgi:Cys-rich repeat protein